MCILRAFALYLALTVCPESALQQLIHLAKTDTICQRCTLNEINEKKENKEEKKRLAEARGQFDITLYVEKQEPNYKKKKK